MFQSVPRLCFFATVNVFPFVNSQFCRGWYLFKFGFSSNPSELFSIDIFTVPPMGNISTL